LYFKHYVDVSTFDLMQRYIIFISAMIAMIATSETQMSPADYLCKHFEQDCSPHGLSNYTS